MDLQKANALGEIDQISQIICQLSDRIWAVPETAFEEVKSAALQCEALKELGFQVETGLAGIPTAFSGRWGSGKPVIGILGEFDALSGLSQRAGVAVKEPLEAGGAGHGCGHNLLGSGSIAAAYGVKRYLEETGKPGTVVYFGCPGEEGGSGKAFMARDGVFDELDFAITWHPGNANCAWAGSSLANIQARYHFTGTASHAAATPHLGRSALDALELMNVGVQFLREHIIPEARIHYAIINTGGYSPNVVQPEAEVLYLIRAPKTPQVLELYERVNDIARGAALMTGTQVDIQFAKACSNLVPNETVSDALYENLHQVPLPEYTREELDFMKEIDATIHSSAPILGLVEQAMTQEQLKQVKVHADDLIYRFIAPRLRTDIATPGSTDVGDVSWVCPTGQITAATMAAKTPGHSWQTVAQGTCGVAHKGMLYAAKVMAGAAIDLVNDPDAVAAAKEELAERLDHKPFVSPVPKDLKPEILR